MTEFGVKVLQIFVFIVNENAGTIEYNTGKIKLNSVLITSVEANDFYNDEIIAFIVKPEEKDLTSKKNSLLDIDENNAKSFVVTLEAE